jgi:hypothetical protein
VCLLLRPSQSRSIITCSLPNFQSRLLLLICLDGNFKCFPKTISFYMIVIVIFIVWYREKARRITEGTCGPGAEDIFGHKTIKKIKKHKTAENFTGLLIYARIHHIEENEIGTTRIRHEKRKEKMHPSS